MLHQYARNDSGVVLDGVKEREEEGKRTRRPVA
jgi:hypothetical protein